jgi:hypothetical protein
VTVKVAAVSESVSPEARVLEAASADPRRNFGVPALSQIPMWVTVAAGMDVKFSVAVRAFCPPDADAYAAVWRAYDPPVTSLDPVV